MFKNIGRHILIAAALVAVANGYGMEWDYCNRVCDQLKDMKVRFITCSYDRENLRFMTTGRDLAAINKEVEKLLIDGFDVVKTRCKDGNKPATEWIAKFSSEKMAATLLGKREREEAEKARKIQQEAAREEAQQEMERARNARADEITRRCQEAKEGAINSLQQRRIEMEERLQREAEAAEYRLGQKKQEMAEQLERHFIKIEECVELARRRTEEREYNLKAIKNEITRMHQVRMETWRKDTAVSERQGIIDELQIRVSELEKRLIKTVNLLREAKLNQNQPMDDAVHLYLTIEELKLFKEEAELKLKLAKKESALLVQAINNQLEELIRRREEFIHTNIQNGFDYYSKIVAIMIRCAAGENNGQITAKSLRQLKSFKDWKDVLKSAMAEEYMTCSNQNDCTNVILYLLFIDDNNREELFNMLLQSDRIKEVLPSNLSLPKAKKILKSIATIDFFFK
ncbi:MAG: hypothetical protein LBO02_02675 [Holosporaceae bacterium]|jgi:hypothetical protein|nr:hypothetical protein [Holosporaceae bacterium]